MPSSSPWEELTLEAWKKKIVTQTLEEREGGGGRGVNRTPSTFDTIHTIDMKFGTYNKVHLYFRLSETTWCLMGFHGNKSKKNDATSGRHLGFLSFQILFKFEFLYFKNNEKTSFSD